MYDLVKSCRICGAADLDSVLDLGTQPLANHLRYPDDRPPEAVPLDLRLCSSCWTAQISATVCPDLLFGTYLWVTGTSATARRYSKIFADRVDLVLSALDGVGRKSSRFIVEVASNDGTFLRPFLERGWQALGVEPASNIADAASANGVPTLVEFFGTEIADVLQRGYGCADVVVARNVVPHVADVHSVIEGLATVAGDDGVVVVEAHSADVILNELHYDSIYHEHLYYFSLETLCDLCERHGLFPFDVFESPISGGSNVVFFSKRRHRPSCHLVEAFDRGNSLKVHSRDRWAVFADSAIKHATALREVVHEYSLSGKVIGYGASARSSTMLNFAGITSGDVEAVIDENNLKQGRLTAGSNIPIVSPEAGMGKIGRSDAVLLLAWNFEEELVGLLRGSGFRGDIVVPLPRTIRIL